MIAQDCKTCPVPTFEREIYDCSTLCGAVRRAYSIAAQVREEKIGAAMRDHYEECKALGYEIFGLFLQGSQNYQLGTTSSDVDTKAIVLPSFEQFAMNQSTISTTHIRDNNEHIDIKDICTMFNTFKKQNINFIEILFTPYFIPNPKYADLIEELREFADSIASAHFNQSLRCMIGMMMEKAKALCHPYPSLVDKIEKYGYDPKQLYTIVRLKLFMEKFVQGAPYRDCLVLDRLDREFLIKIKIGSLTLEEAQTLAHDCVQAATQLKNDSMRVPEIVDGEKYKILDKIRIDALKRFFKEQILN